MRKLFLLLLFVPLLVSAQAGPKLEIEGGENINTGSHIRGKEVHYDITFKNVGDQDLKITSVSTSCGCSSALASADLLKPGESGKIDFMFNGLSMGTVQKNVMIQTNETLTPFHTIVMTMKMLEPVTFNPQSIITEGKVGDELTTTAVLTNSLEKQLDIIELTSNSPVIKITSDKNSLASGKAASLSIKIKIYEDSEINAAVIVRTTEGEFQIPVLVEVKQN